VIDDESLSLLKKGYLSIINYGDGYYWFDGFNNPSIALFSTYWWESITKETKGHISFQSNQLIK
jgi:hypothetical protein